MQSLSFCRAACVQAKAKLLALAFKSALSSVSSSDVMGGLLSLGWGANPEFSTLLSSSSPAATRSELVNEQNAFFFRFNTQRGF